ncbi:DUF2809 domain-containing protein [Mycetocola spongiae]|uniref:DUF2809 domain-containing protein n=1 Tax=Mycetocola spongiae TaxID=2859226 RepID=UPI001CF5CFE5|nr:DUF2809 domain-containing protein [Mycetocola spongiae]UCR88270.1 DUF2809 domain-containing protein [Mycetocola spongiae]
MRWRALTLAGALLLLIPVGLLASRGIPGATGDILGDVLYAVAVYLGLALLLLASRRGRARVAPWALGAAALLLCAGIEAFQATGIPARLGESWSGWHYLLGSTFAWRDLAAYALGALGAAALDRASGRFRGSSAG